MWRSPKRFIRLLSTTSLILSIFITLNSSHIRHGHAQAVTSRVLTAQLSVTQLSATQLSVMMMPTTTLVAGSLPMVSLIKTFIRYVPSEIYIPIAGFVYDLIRDRLVPRSSGIHLDRKRSSYCQYIPVICDIGGALKPALKPALEILSYVDSKIFQGGMEHNARQMSSKLDLIGVSISRLLGVGGLNVALNIANAIHEEIRFRELERANQRRHSQLMDQVRGLYTRVDQLESRLLKRIDRLELDHLSSRIKSALKCVQKINPDSPLVMVNTCIDNVSRVREALDHRDLLPLVSLELSATETLLYQRYQPKNTNAISVILRDADQRFISALSQAVISSRYCGRYGRPLKPDSAASEIIPCQPDQRWISRELHHRLSQELSQASSTSNATELIREYKGLYKLSRGDDDHVNEIIRQIHSGSESRLQEHIKRASSVFHSALNVALKSWSAQFKRCASSHHVRWIIERALSSSEDAQHVQATLNLGLSEQLTKLINTALSEAGAHSKLSDTLEITSRAHMKRTDSLTGVGWGAFASLNTSALGMLVFAGYQVYTAGLTATVLAGGATAIANSMFVPSLTLAAIVGVGATVGTAVWYRSRVRAYKRNKRIYMKRICRGVLKLQHKISREMSRVALSH